MTAYTCRLGCQWGPCYPASLAATLGCMAYEPDETRPLYQQVVDGIEAQIADGRLGPDDKVPSAKVISETYGVANMTAQRALRELQQRGVTYGVAGRGSFVRPDAVSRLTRTAKPITTDEQYRAAMNEFKDAVGKARTDVDTALATGDIQQIMAARAAQEQVWNSYHQQLVEMTLYSHRVAQAGRNPAEIYPTTD
jgi:DNA-binding GntR family transcriptional regulator